MNSFYSFLEDSNHEHLCPFLPSFWSLRVHFILQAPVGVCQYISSIKIFYRKLCFFPSMPSNPATHINILSSFLSSGSMTLQTRGSLPGLRTGAWTQALEFWSGAECTRSPGESTAGGWLSVKVLGVRDGSSKRNHIW